MFSFIFLVFCADPVDCGNNLFYRSGPPPAAARADGVDQAKIFMNALSATITSRSSSALPKLDGYTVLAGQTLFDADNTTIIGSVLQVSGWRVFVAKTRLEAVTKTMVDSLLGMFAQAKAAYEKLPEQTKVTADSTAADEIGTAAAKQKTDEAAAQKRLDEAAAAQQRQVDIQLFGIGDLPKTDSDNFLARLGKLGTDEQKQFRTEWKAAKVKIVSEYANMSTTERDTLFALCPIQFSVNKESEGKLRNQELAYTAINSAQGDDEAKKDARDTYAKAIGKNKSPEDAWNLAMEEWVRYYKETSTGSGRNKKKVKIHYLRIDTPLFDRI